MQISTHESILYIFIGIVATIGIFLSRMSGEGRASFFSGGKPSFWFISALSLFAGSILQFLILLLPVLSLSQSTVLVVLALIVTMIVPVIFMKDRQRVMDGFIDLLSGRMKSLMFVVNLIFFLVIQPLTLLYLGEKIIAQLMGGAYHVILVFMISAAGLLTLIGGKKVVTYSNAIFGITVILAAAIVMLVGGSVSAPVMMIGNIIADGAEYFHGHNVIETHWGIGFIGFSVIMLWMWWIDNGVIHGQREQSEQRNSSAAMFTSFSLIVVALVVMVMQTRSDAAAEYALGMFQFGAMNQASVIVFVLGFVSVMMAALSQSFLTVASLVTWRTFHAQSHGTVDDKHVLVARLVIAASALLMILFISFVQFFGAMMLVVYVQYLSCFAASIVGAFTVFVFRKKYHTFGAAAGIIGGTGAGMILVILSYGNNDAFAPFIGTPYGATTGIFLFSIVCSLAGSLLAERRTAKRSIVI
ncbi:MAG: hypothetical protein ACOYNS_06980 [Bacteroidota bacterium]